MEFSNKKINIISIVWMLLVTGLVFLPHVPVWIVMPIVLSGIIVVPGILWLLNLNITSEKISEYLLYAIGSGLAFLMFGGLAINTILPWFGVHQPLAQLPSVVFLDLSVAILLIRGYVLKKSITVRQLVTTNATSVFFGVLPVVFLILSMGGAEILNNGGQGTLTLVMLFAVALYIVLLIIKRRSIQSWVYVSALYLIGLSVLLMYSLRSAHILGWDINQEYGVFQMTLQHLVWKANYFPGLDYNACLSITILPTMFKELTHVSAEYVFKFIFQVLFAVTPVMAYVFARRYLNDALAFLAGFLFLSQTWFFEQMPGLIRQETAFIFFGLLLLALFNDKLTKTARYILVTMAIIAVILAHYSTAYVMIILILVAMLISYVVRLIKPFKKQSLIFAPWIIIAALGVLLVWQIPVTQTVGKVAQFVTNDNHPDTAIPAPTQTAIVVTQTPALPPVTFQSVAPKKTLLEDVKTIVLTTFFANPTPNNVQILDASKAYAMKTYYYSFYPDTVTAPYVSAPISTSTLLAPKLPHVVSSMLVVATKIIKLLAIDVLPLAGVVVLYMEFRKTQSDKMYKMIILGAGGCALIILMILIPYLQIYYNLTRLFLQMFMFLSTFAIIGAMAIMNRIKYGKTWLAVLLAIVFLIGTGFVDQFTGGPAHLTLNQPPSTMDGLYIHSSEIAAAQWLLHDRNYADPVEADAQSNLRLQSFAQMSSANTAVFPETIDPKGYIYVSTNNLMSGTDTYEFNNFLLTFNYPFDFIKHHKDLIYNSGGSEIYH